MGEPLYPDGIVDEAYAIGNDILLDEPDYHGVVQVKGVSFTDPYWLFIKEVKFDAPSGKVAGKESEFARSAAGALMRRDYDLRGAGCEYEIVVGSGHETWTFAQLSFAPSGEGKTRVSLTFLETGYTGKDAIAGYVREAGALFGLGDA